MNSSGHAIILGVTADIGINLSRRMLDDGWRVTGIGRDKARVGALLDCDKFSFEHCDLASSESIRDAVRTVCDEWTLFVSVAGTMEPIGPFFDLDFDAWQTSVEVNSIAQLRVLHGIWGLRAKEPHVMLLAGGGTNNAFTNYSAYCVSKIALIKMCELIHDEDPDVNAFIIGPGYMRTRIHNETLKAGDLAGTGLEKTKSLLEKGQGTTHEELYSHLKWCINQGRHVAGGRNFSTVHDAWRDGGQELADLIRNSHNVFRLRRMQSEQ